MISMVATAMAAMERSGVMAGARSPCTIHFSSDVILWMEIAP